MGGGVNVSPNSFGGVGEVGSEGEGGDGDGFCVEVFVGSVLSTSIFPSPGGTSLEYPGPNIVTHPLLILLGRPKSSSRRRPRQKFSMRVYISFGLRVGSEGSEGAIRTSVSVRGC